MTWAAQRMGCGEHGVAGEQSGDRHGAADDVDRQRAEEDGPAGGGHAQQPDGKVAQG